MIRRANVRKPQKGGVVRNIPPGKVWRCLVLQCAFFICALIVCRTNLKTHVHADDEQPESTAAAPVKPQPPKELAPEEKAALAEGQALFRGLCSGCHGGMGRGGKGPDLTDNRWLHGDRDEDISHVIKNGVPGTTMKKLGESLKEQQFAAIIA